jgi:hypothetical protein
MVEKAKDGTPVGRGLPRVSAQLRDTIQDFITETYNSKRPPTVAATILGLIIELSHKRQPFPTRATVAEFANCSIFTVDSTISQCLQRGLITESVETVEGNVQKRESIIRHRYYTPTKRLLMAAGVSKAA